MASTYSDTLTDYAQNVKRYIQFEIEFELLQIADYLIALLKQVTRDWVNKPKFDYKLKKLRNGYLLTVFTEDTIFEYVDQGTDGPYIIRPKKPGGYLKFRGGYDAKTQPVARFGVGSGESTGRWTTTELVIHPGIQARQFMKTAETELEKTLERRIEQAMMKGIRRAS